MSANAAAMTTVDLGALLSARYASPEFALFFDVPDAVSTRQRRRADAIAVGLWPSTGNLVHGFELKVSRPDWLAELRKVEKADPFLEICDRWWWVTADRVIAKDAEIPTCWGWMSATKKGLRVERPASVLPRDRHQINRMFAVGLFRKLSEDILKLPEVRSAIATARERSDKLIEDRIRIAVDNATSNTKRMRERVEAFEATSGMKLDDWRLGDVGALAKVIHELHVDRGLDAVANTLRIEDEQLTQLLERIKTARAAIAERAEATKS